MKPDDFNEGAAGIDNDLDLATHFDLCEATIKRFTDLLNTATSGRFGYTVETEERNDFGNKDGGSPALIISLVPEADTPDSPGRVEFLVNKDGIYTQNSYVKHWETGFYNQPGRSMLDEKGRLRFSDVRPHAELNRQGNMILSGFRDEKGNLKIDCTAQKAQNSAAYRGYLAKDKAFQDPVAALYDAYETFLKDAIPVRQRRLFFQGNDTTSENFRLTHVPGNGGGASSVIAMPPPQ